MGDDKITTTKLNAKNYLVWKLTIITILQAKELWSLCQRNDETKESAVKNAEAKAIILGSMEDAQKARVGSHETAHKLWLKIQTVYEGPLELLKTKALHAFMNLSYKKNEKMGDYCTRFETLLTTLLSTSYTPDEQTKIWVFKNSLPKDLYNKVDTWEMCNKQPRVEDIVALMRSHEERETSDEGTVALLAQKKLPQGPGRKKSDNGKRCYYCKQDGHIKKECRKLRHDQRDQHALKSQSTDVSRKDQAYMAFSGDQPVLSNEEWIVDSGASRHMTPDKFLLTHYVALDTPLEVTLGDGSTTKGYGLGSVYFKNGHLSEVLWVPGLKENLFSVKQALNNGFDVTFNSNKKRVDVVSQGRVTLSGPMLKLGLFALRIAKTPSRTPVQERAYLGAPIEEWHKRFAHAGRESIRELMNKDAAKGLIISKPEENHCLDCLRGKICRTHHSSRRKMPGAKHAVILHIDTCGPLQTTSLGGSRYFVLATDDYSGFKFIKFVSMKSEVGEAVMLIIHSAELLSGKMVKLICTDNGSEYKNSVLDGWLKRRGTLHDFATSYTPEQNGTAERANRTVIDGVRTLLASSGLPEKLWPEAANTVVYASNRLLSQRDRTKTRYELFTGDKPDVGNLRIFGQYAVLHQPKHLRRGKWSVKGKLVRFVGYTGRSNTYRFYDEDRDNIIIGCDVKFLPTTFEPRATEESNQEEMCISLGDTESSKGKTGPGTGSSTISDGKPSDADVMQEFSDDSLDLSAARDRSSVRFSDATTVNYFQDEEGYTELVGDRTDGQSKIGSRIGSPVSPPEPNLSSECLNKVIHDEIREKSGKNYARLDIPNSIASSIRPLFLNDRLMTPEEVERTREAISKGMPADSRKTRANFAYLTLEGEPQSLKQAMASDEWTLWKQAMDEEMDALEANSTWVMVDRPPKVRPIKNKWVFKVKLNPDGSVERHKARLVAKGFTQIPNIDFKETFAPVASMNTIRILFGVANQNRMEVLQFDVKTAFLHGDLDENLYMEPPEGYSFPEGKVCKLLKSLYGLKQAPRQWNLKFNRFLKDFHLQQSKVDRCLYFNTDRSIILVIYVDDGLVAAKDKSRIDNLIKYLQESLEIKVMECEAYLGFQVIRDREHRTTTLCQKAYLERVLERFNMQDCKPTSIPEEVGVFSDENSPLLGPEYPYKAAIGSLLYLVTCTRPDIAHAVGIASRTSAPTQAHWQLIKRIFRYLSGTRDLGIHFRWEKEPPKLVGFSDADYANDVATRRSTSGYAIFYGQTPVAWRCQRQQIVSLSTTEAEYISGCELVKDLLPIREMMLELRQIKDEPVQVMVDNQSTVAIAKDVAGQQRTKHIDVRQKWLSEQHAQGKIQVSFVPGEQQKADMLTKPLHKTKFQQNRNYFLAPIALLVLMYISMALGFSFKPVTPVVFQDTQFPYFSGIKDFELQYKELNLCTRMFGNVTNREDWNSRLTKDCNEMFADATSKVMTNCGSNNTIKKHVMDAEIRNKLSNPFPRKFGNTISEPLTRTTRAVQALAAAAVAVVGSAGTVYAVVKSTLNANNIDILFDQQQELVKVTQQAEKVINTTIENIKVLDENNKALAGRIDYIDRSINNYPVVLSRFVFVSNYLEELKSHLININKDLKIYRISADLLDLVRKPLWEEPASRWSILKDCKVEDGTDFKLSIRFVMPVHNRDIRILRARSFKFWNQTSPGRFCYTKYSGPRFVITNITNNCYDDLDSEQVIDDSVTGYLCNRQDQGLDRIENVFSRQACASKPQYHNKEQVIRYGSDNYIYCPEQHIQIHEKQYPCPEHVFALPLAESFVLEHFAYTASKRAETVINTLEKQMNDDITTRLRIDNVKIIGVNSTKLELEYGKLGRLVDNLMSQNVTLMKMHIPVALRSPLDMVTNGISTIREWLERGVLVLAVGAGIVILTLVLPSLEIIALILRFGLRAVKRLVLTFRLAMSAPRKSKGSKKSYYEDMYVVRMSE